MVILLQCGVMVSMFTSGIVNHGFQLRLGKTKVHKIGICCFSAKHTSIKEKEQRLVGSESERYVYLRTVVSVS